MAFIEEILLDSQSFHETRPGGRQFFHRIADGYQIHAGESVQDLSGIQNDFGRLNASEAELACTKKQANSGSKILIQPGVELFDRWFRSCRILFRSEGDVLGDLGIPGFVVEEQRSARNFPDGGERLGGMGGDFDPFVSSRKGQNRKNRIGKCGAELVDKIRHKLGHSAAKSGTYKNRVDFVDSRILKTAGEMPCVKIRTAIVHFFHRVDGR